MPVYKANFGQVSHLLFTFRADIDVRLGGDEFAIVQFRNDPWRVRVTALAARVIETISKEYYIQNKRLDVGASLGIAFSQNHESDIAGLVNAADQAMYRAKADKKSTFMFA